MTSRLLVCAALAALVACEGNTTQITPDAGELSACCVSSNNQAAIDQGLGFACGSASRLRPRPRPSGRVPAETVP